MLEAANAQGVYHVVCVGPDGTEKWRDHIDNVVATAGKNLAFGTIFTGAAYTVTGPFMGLISSTSFTAVAATDTMLSHTGWLEAGSANTPTYSGTRPLCVFSAASGGAISLSAALAFTMTGSGTVEGCFIIYGSGATSAIGNTGGTIWSAGLFSSGSKTVNSGDLINVSYTASM